MHQLIEYLPGLFLVYAAFGLGLLSPGPNILAVIATSMSVNRESGIALASGVACGTFCWSFLTVMGLAALLVQFSFILFYLKIIGGFYLLWLAYKVFRSAASTHALAVNAHAHTQKSPAGYVIRGLLIQMSNPKAALAWFAILPLCIDADAPPVVWVAVVLGTTTMSIAGHFTYAILFSTPSAVAAYKKARRVVESGIGTFFTLAGLKLLLSNS